MRPKLRDLEIFKIESYSPNKRYHATVDYKGVLTVSLQQASRAMERFLGYGRARWQLDKAFTEDLSKLRIAFPSKGGIEVYIETVSLRSEFEEQRIFFAANLPMSLAAARGKAKTKTK